jgi:hypothetical protein
MQVVNTVIGSLDGNNTIDAIDLQILQQYLAGNIAAPGTAPWTGSASAGDLNGDSLINAVDLQIMQQYLAGNITTLPCTTCN